MVGASLRLAGRYEPYGLICLWLNVKRPGRCAPLGAQGVDVAHGFSYKAKTFRTTACFPLFTHRGINYPPATGWSPFLSRKELRFASFPFVEILHPTHLSY